MTIYRAAMAALLLALLALAAYGLADFAYFGPLRLQDARTVELLGQVNDLIEREAHTRSALASTAARSSSGFERFLARSGDISTSAASLQETIRSAIASAGGTALSSQASVQPLDGNISKVSVLVRARFDELGMLNFTRMLESAEPPVLIEAFEAHPLPIAGNATPLDITGVLVGFAANAN